MVDEQKSEAQSRAEQEASQNPFAPSVELIKSAADGSESAKLALDILEQQRLAEIATLKAELKLVTAQNIAQLGLK